MIKFFSVIFFLILYNGYCSAETIKTDILVIGNTAAGTAAAIQGARSKLKTLLIYQGPAPNINADYGTQKITGNKDISAGIWGEVKRSVIKLNSKVKGYDTTATGGLTITNTTIPLVLKSITDTVKNLTVKYNTLWIAVKKDGNGWAVEVKNGELLTTIKTRVLIDATATADLAGKTGASFNAAGELLTLSSSNANNANLYKTSIAAVQPFNAAALTVSLGAVVVKGADNLLIALPQLPNNIIADDAMQLAIGQGVGAVAAYCAFFKTSTTAFNAKTVRIVQGELLDFKSCLIPFIDIPAGDKDYRAIQQIGATGLLKANAGSLKNNGTMAIYAPDSLIITSEIQPVFNEIYTRAFLWFNKTKPGQYFTVANMLSFISEITLREPKTFQLDMQKQWQPVYKFNTVFELKNPITRRQFAILTNKFLNPFARYVDVSGKMIN